MRDKFKCKSTRLCKYLYSLGFNKESYIDNTQTEYWLFDKSGELKESLDFYFYMRAKTGDANYAEIIKGRNKEKT